MDESRAVQILSAVHEDSKAPVLAETDIDPQSTVEKHVKGATVTWSCATACRIPDEL